MDKYGRDNFSFEIIESGLDKESANNRERFWIKFYDSYKDGYNCSLGGEGGNTYAKLSEEQMKVIRKKISDSKKGDKNPVRRNPELVRGKNNGMYGKTPHNVQPISIMNIETQEIFSFISNKECADFMGYKNGNPISQWKKDKAKIKRGYKLL